MNSQEREPQKAPNKLLNTVLEREVQTLWDKASLFRAPPIFKVETLEEGVSAFFYESVPWRGKATRMFAYYGTPAKAPAGKLPAMVLVHGGLGSAYAEWVRLWTSRGYAAIAMDHFGAKPEVASPGQPYGFSRHRHPLGGPSGAGGFSQVDEPVGDQWTFHAVAAVVLANSLLRTFAEVDAERIGLAGISWGGVIAAIAASIDPRFRFAVPVYGCGFLTEESTYFAQDVANMSHDQHTRWKALWDPARYLPSIQMPTLWINGTNDIAFPLSSWQKSVRTRQSTKVSATDGILALKAARCSVRPMAASRGSGEGDGNMMGVFHETHHIP